MATSVTAHIVVPLHLTGDTTEVQNKALQEMLGETVKNAYTEAIELLDQQSAQTVLDAKNRLKGELVDQIVATIQRYTLSDRYKDEAVSSTRVYPAVYRVRPIEAQVTELRKHFPLLNSCNEKLARRKLPDGAEAWFAVPRWQSLAPSYNEAVQMMIDAVASKRRFSNRIVGKLNEKFLRECSRSKLAQTVLCDQQEGQDIHVIAAQFGMLHRGSSARRTRSVLHSNEFALGTFALATMLLTHPERLSSGETLMIDCGGDEYSVRGDYSFDRVPLFDYDIAGIEFSIFYEDRARNLWGTPTAFLFKLV